MLYVYTYIYIYTYTSARRTGLRIRNSDAIAGFASERANGRGAV